MELKATLREETGTRSSKQARREGKLPVALYGGKGETQSLLVDAGKFEAILRSEGANAVFELNIDGKKQKVWIKDFQKAALVNEFYSVDLEAITADQKLTVEVPLLLVNVETVKEGMVELVMNTLEVETTPDAIPQSIEIDVTGMEIGNTKAVSDIEIPENVEVLADAEQTVVSVSAPTEEPAEGEEGATEEVEPEVIGEEEE